MRAKKTFTALLAMVILLSFSIVRADGADVDNLYYYSETETKISNNAGVEYTIPGGVYIPIHEKLEVDGNILYSLMFPKYSDNSWGIAKINVEQENAGICSRPDINSYIAPIDMTYYLGEDVAELNITQNQNQKIVVTENKEDISCLLYICDGNNNIVEKRIDTKDIVLVTKMETQLDDETHINADIKMVVNQSYIIKQSPLSIRVLKEAVDPVTKKNIYKSEDLNIPYSCVYTSITDSSSVIKSSIVSGTNYIYKDDFIVNFEDEDIQTVLINENGEEVHSVPYMYWDAAIEANAVTRIKLSKEKIVPEEIIDEVTEADNKSLFWRDADKMRLMDTLIKALTCLIFLVLSICAVVYLKRMSIDLSSALKGIEQTIKNDNAQAKYTYNKKTDKIIDGINGVSAKINSVTLSLADRLEKKEELPDIKVEKEKEQPVIVNIRIEDSGTNSIKLIPTKNSKISVEEYSGSQTVLLDFEKLSKNIVSNYHLVKLFDIEGLPEFSADTAGYHMTQPQIAKIEGTDEYKVIEKGHIVCG